MTTLIKMILCYLVVGMPRQKFRLLSLRAQRKRKNLILGFNTRKARKIRNKIKLKIYQQVFKIQICVRTIFKPKIFSRSSKKYWICGAIWKSRILIWWCRHKRRCLWKNGNLGLITRLTSMCLLMLSSKINKRKKCKLRIVSRPRTGTVWFWLKIQKIRLRMSGKKFWNWSSKQWLIWVKRPLKRGRRKTRRFSITNLTNRKFNLRFQTKTKIITLSPMRECKRIRRPYFLTHRSLFSSLSRNFCRRKGLGGLRRKFSKDLSFLILKIGRTYITTIKDLFRDIKMSFHWLGSLDKATTKNKWEWQMFRYSLVFTTIAMSSILALAK